MPETLTKEIAISEIIKETKKMSKVELEVLLGKLRLQKLRKNLLTDAIAANPAKEADMSEIDKWKHESRK